MHLAYIHQHFSTTEGTTGTRSYEFAKRLVLAKHQVTMVCGLSDNSPPALRSPEPVHRLEVEGIRILCINEPYSNAMGFARRSLAFSRFARHATSIVSGLDVDLVFATSTPLTVGIPGMRAAKRLGVPFVFEVRDLWPELPIAMGIVRNPLLKWYLRSLERRIYRAADHIIALSPGIKQGICNTAYPAERVSMIPNAADVDMFRPASERLQDPAFGEPDEFRLVFTGAHGAANGLNAVLDAAAELKRRGEQGIRFIFIGRGKEREQLIARSQREGLDHFTTWIEAVRKDKLAWLLPRLDAGMMILKNVPAFYYGTSPNKFFDYIASGLPVLNNYPGWLADMITEHRCGLVVPPDDPVAFADAVVWLRDHREEAQQMGARGRALAESRFSRDDLATQFIACLETVLSRASVTKRT